MNYMADYSARGGRSDQRSTAGSGGTRRSSSSSSNRSGSTGSARSGRSTDSPRGGTGASASQRRSGSSSRAEFGAGRSGASRSAGASRAATSGGSAGGSRSSRSAEPRRSAPRPSTSGSWWEPGGSTPSSRDKSAARRPDRGSSRPTSEERPNRSARPTRDGQTSQDNRPARGNRPVRDNRPDRSDRANRDDRPARDGGSRRDERPARDGGIRRDDRPRPARHNPDERPSFGGRSQRSGAGAQPGRRPSSGSPRQPDRSSRRDERPSDRYSERPSYRRREPEEDYEATRGSRPTRGTEIPIPSDADPRTLDPSVRSELRSLSKLAAEFVGGHLVAAGRAIEDNPILALEHARAARGRGARVAAVREACGLAAYQAGEWAEALSELRAARRISGDPSAIAVMADCERALGRPQRALKALEDPAVGKLDPATRLELLIVVAGARRDLGQLDAALSVLERGGLDIHNPRPGSARLWYAYADALQAAGRTADAIQWFGAAATVDHDDETDAADRAAGLL